VAGWPEPLSDNLNPPRTLLPPSSSSHIHRPRRFRPVSTSWPAADQLRQPSAFAWYAKRPSEFDYRRAPVLRRAGRKFCQPPNQPPTTILSLAPPPVPFKAQSFCRHHVEAENWGQIQWDGDFKRGRSSWRVRGLLLKSLIPKRSHR